MALGKRKTKQQELFIASNQIPKTPAHPFYSKLNQAFDECGFDAYVEELCAPLYKNFGRPGIAPGIYFRMIFIGYFEGLNSQRGIAWRCHDSLCLREFLGISLTEKTPVHASMTIIRQRLSDEVFHKVFLFVLEQLKEKKLLKGKTLGVDATTLEANAAMRSIVRKGTGEDWKEYLRELAKEEGIENPSDEDIQRIDRGRKGKKVSNKEWQSKSDPDSRITKMKDGRTHLAYKAEHSVDLETEAIVSCHVTHADQGDTTTGPESLILAEANLQLIESERTVEEAVMDKGYHSNALLERLTQWGIRTYIPEKKQKKRKWVDKPESYEHAFRGNRRRVRSDKGKRLSRKRSELVEGTFAHVCETGAGRRTWLRGMENVTKIHTLKCAAFNLGLLMRKIFGLAKPRNWEASLATALAAAFFMIFGEWMTQGAVKMSLTTLLLISTILLCCLMKSERDEIRIIRFFEIGTY